MADCPRFWAARSVNTARLFLYCQGPMQKTGQKIPPAHCRPQGSAMGGIFWDRMFGCRAAGGGARKDRCGTVCTEIRCIPPSGAPPQPAKRPLRRSTAARSARRLRFIAVLKSGLLSAKQEAGGRFGLFQSLAASAVTPEERSNRSRNSVPDSTCPKGIREEDARKSR